jgi:predicted phage terminase large subunit-like protein
MTLHHPRLAEAIVRTNLYAFFRVAFPLVSPGGPLAENWHLRAIAHALQLVLEGKTRRLVINVPPRSLKSTLSSVVFPAFVLGVNPRNRFIGASYSENLAFTFSRSCRDLMRSPLYQRLFPNTRIASGRDSQMEFATTAGGYRLSTSVGGSLTGRGGNYVVIDDPLKAQDAFSASIREANNEWFGNTLLSRLDNKATDRIVVVMQRLHADDLSGYLLERGGWTHLNIPAIAEHEHDVPIGPNCVHHRKIGDILHAERESLSVLNDLKLEMGSTSFAAQFQQTPVAEDGNLIKWSWFKFYDAPPHLISTDRLVISWDTASSTKDLASYSAAVVLLVHRDTVYVLEVVRERLEYPELRRRVIQLHQKWRNALSSYWLLIENKGSGMGLIQDLRREHIHAIPINPEGDKIIRMNNQTGRIEAGSVWLPRSAPWLEEFRRELCAFPGGRHSDQVDAFSQALNRVFAPRTKARMIAVAGGW